jgi:hypothetical protein
MKKKAYLWIVLALLSVFCIATLNNFLVKEKTINNQNERITDWVFPQKINKKTFDFVLLEGSNDMKMCNVYYYIKISNSKFFEMNATYFSGKGIIRNDGSQWLLTHCSKQLFEGKENEISLLKQFESATYYEENKLYSYHNNIYYKLPILDDTIKWEYVKLNNNDIEYDCKSYFDKILINKKEQKVLIVERKDIERQSKRNILEFYCKEYYIKEGGLFKIENIEYSTNKTIAEYRLVESLFDKKMSNAYISDDLEIIDKSNQTLTKKPIANKNQVRENIDSNSKQIERVNKYYYITSEKAFFYQNSNYENMRKAYLVKDEKIQALKDTLGFIYVEFVNASGRMTKGWISKSDITDVYNQDK